MATEYTLTDIDEIEDDVEFVQWLGEEGFVNVDNVFCDYCESNMVLQGEFIYNFMNVVGFCLLILCFSIF
jgi:hypothetical protein